METLVAVSVIGPVVGAALAYWGCRRTIKRLQADLLRDNTRLIWAVQDYRLKVRRIHELECQLARRHHRKMPKLPDPLMQQWAA